MSRRRLFTTRRKLFSSSDEELLEVYCNDCGFEMNTAANPGTLRCPRCGGRRFEVSREFFSPPGTPEETPENYRRPVLRDQTEEEFQREFSRTSDELELELRRFSGRTLTSSEYDKYFSVPSEDLVEKGFASIQGDKVSISDTAFLESRLFSKLIVSVTKVLDLDPEVACSSRDRVLDDLESNSELCPKSIAVLRRVSVPGSLSSTSSHESWANDSGILGDLKLEFGGQTRSLPEFKGILVRRYPDAPSGIMDFLMKRGIIRSSGGGIEIIK